MADPEPEAVGTTVWTNEFALPLSRNQGVSTSCSYHQILVAAESLTRHVSQSQQKGMHTPLSEIAELRGYHWGAGAEEAADHETVYLGVAKGDATQNQPQQD
ncbi:hypothetical protein EDB81DRAFT_767824 [Dactylonectria macrodidyma]|uniref:Uncharacterized protein n=1 Tax=Dactylonectria macrodidyma TaxID=307937 RepID=A0A9P9IAX6_9HYPO|nr:hypothetical protein EDB81DRAFT_767824 [Dactylonectria macrodidyma]